MGANNTVTTLEDSAYVFSGADFGFSDPNDSPADALLAVRITTLPGAGTLWVSGGPVLNAGDVVSVADITAGKLVFTPGADANGAGYASFSFQVQDDGGTVNGGVDTDQTPRTMSIDVTAGQRCPGAHGCQQSERDRRGCGEQRGHAGLGADRGAGQRRSMPGR